MGGNISQRSQLRESPQTRKTFHLAMNEKSPSLGTAHVNMLAGRWPEANSSRPSPEA